MKISTLACHSAIIFSLMAPTVQAAWTLDNQDSSINFISVKKEKVAEVNHFNAFNASIDNEGEVALQIDLTSVETDVEIRNERMENYLFKTDQFSHAGITASLDAADIAALKPGQRLPVDVKLSVNLHGETESLMAKLIITRLTETTLSIHSQQPLILNASDFELIDGINKLAELASLDSIVTAVPITVDLIFTQQ